MKFCYIFIACLLMTATTVYSQDCSLLAKNYKLKEGDTISYQLYSGKGLKLEELHVGHADSIRNVVCINGGKKVDSIGSARFSSIQFTAEKHGQNFLAFEFTGESLEVPSDEIGALVKTKKTAAIDSATTEEAEETDEFAMGTEYIAAPHFSVKALTCTEGNSGKFYEAKLNQQLEIVLSQSPYKLQYGDDLTGAVLFLGKPIAGIAVKVFVKSMGDNVYQNEYHTDDEGRFFFKLNRSGNWLIQTAYARASKAEKSDSDYDYWQSSFSFGF
ncbi:protein of unknown function [bacterium A37T11]|nr:protein of unknown function [bacterium A37T11]